MAALNRRQVLGLGALLCAPGSAVLADAPRPLVLSAASDADERHWIVGIRLGGTALETVFKHQLPERAHHIAIDSVAGIYVVVARRPGTFSISGMCSSR